MQKTITIKFIGFREPQIVARPIRDVFIDGAIRRGALFECGGPPFSATEEIYFVPADAPENEHGRVSTQYMIRVWRSKEHPIDKFKT